MTDLRVGAAILKEAIELDTEKQKRLDQAKREEKAAAAAVASNVRSSYHLCYCIGPVNGIAQVKLAFLDDRKTKSLRDQRERERREARAVAAANATLDENRAPSELMGSPPTSPSPSMPGDGRSLISIRSVDEGDEDSD